MDNSNQHRHTQLCGVITEILRDHPQGLSEYELLRCLDGGDLPEFNAPSFHDSADLFRLHFLLFHTLYRLREQLAGEYALDISPLKINLRPHTAGPTRALAEPDPLREYYLDLSHLQQTTDAEIDSMLGQFWQRLGAGNERRQALQVLQLSDPVDYATIKRRYRELAMRYHPDRGGDHATLQTINLAMAVLERSVAHEGSAD